MKKNHLQQTFPHLAPIRLVDVGPKIEFPPRIKHVDWVSLQRHLPATAVSMLTFVLVLHLTVGSGAAVIAPAPAPAPALTQPVSISAPQTVLFEAIGNSLSAEQLGAESQMLSRSRAASSEIRATISELNTAQTTETAARELQEEAKPEQAETTGAAAKPSESEPAETTEVPKPEATQPAAVKTSTPAAVDSNSALTAEQQQQIIDFSRSLLGVPYVYAGTSATGLDCSGFTLFVYRELFGISIPHKSSDQVNVGISVAKADVRVGDILCFDWDYNSVCDHVAIYIGNGKYVNASQSRGKVTEQIVNFEKDPVIAVRRLIA